MPSLILKRLLPLLLWWASLASGLAAAGVPKKRVVVVTGAGGQTGQAVYRKLLAAPNNEFAPPIGVCRTQESKQALVESILNDFEDLNESDLQIMVCDVAQEGAFAKMIASLSTSTTIDALCIGTSAKPSPTGKVHPETGRPVLGFPHGSPRQVDWLGQKYQIDAMPAGCHIVLCSSMGGTDPNHVLNNIGKDPQDPLSGNILQWKRKAEVYLTQQTDKQYTIVHPGGLLNEPGGERELVIGVDDEMTGTDSRSIPRQDVAQVMVEAVRHPDVYAGRSFDLRAKPVGDGRPTTDFAALIQDGLKGRNCDYSLGKVADDEMATVDK